MAIDLRAGEGKLAGDPGWRIDLGEFLDEQIGELVRRGDLRRVRAYIRRELTPSDFENLQKAFDEAAREVVRAALEDLELKPSVIRIKAGRRPRIQP